MSTLAALSAHVGATVSSVVPTAYVEIMGGWSPSPDMQMWGRWIAAALLIFWVAYILFKMVTPKKGATRQINWVGLGMSGVVAMILMNLQALPGIINNVGKLFYSLGNMLGIY